MTHTTKHTPGPWVVDDEVSADEAGQETLGVYAEQGGYIAGIHCGPDTVIDECDKANAHLIAAAPAMYEALVKTMKVLRSLRDSKEEWYTLVTPELLTAWDMNKAALSQAEGR